MVTAGVLVVLGRASKVAHHKHQGLVEQAALLEVGEQGRLLALAVEAATAEQRHGYFNADSL